MHVLPLAFVCASAGVGQLTPEASAEILKSELAYLADVRSYVARSSSLAPERAAAEWLELFDNGQRVPTRPLMNGGNAVMVGEPTTAISSLPRADAWPHIANLIDRRPESQQSKALHILFLRLQGDDEELVKATENWPYSTHSSDVEELRFDAFRRMRDVDGQVAIVRQQISTRSGFQRRSLPDLVSLVGEERAKRILGGMLDVARRDIDIDAPVTLRLARRLVLERVNTISRPHWRFAQSLDDREYLRRLVARFGRKALLQPKPDENGSISTADYSPIGIYFADLLLTGKVSEAAAFCREAGYVHDLSINYNPPSHRLRAKLFPAISRLHKLAPDLDVTQLIAITAPAAGKGQLGAKLLEKIAADPKSQTTTRASAFYHLVRLYAGLGDTASLWRTIERGRALESTSNDFSVTGYELLYGLALGDEAVIKRGVDHALSKPQEVIYPHLLVEGLFQTKQYKKLEQHLLAQIGTAGSDARPAYQLLRLYHLTDRPNAAISLLRDKAIWSVADLKEILRWAPDQGFWDRDDRYPPIGFFAAWALAKTGDKELAIDCLRRLLIQVGTCDKAFGLLSELIGAKALPFYDSLIRLDLTEPRPLIWKADLLLTLGRLKEAEAAAREAIRIDPSDGRAGIGHRFKVYEVLADVLSRQHKLDQAYSYRLRVQAVRLTERAKQLHDDGMLAQAATMYGKAISTWPGDYIAEEGFAQCLEAQGNLEDADLYRKRAYALLPASLGTAGEVVYDYQSLFTDPGSIRLGLPMLRHASTAAGLYLKARCEAAIGKRRQAVTDLKKAVTKEPRLINAWTELSRLGGEGYLNPQETDAASLRALELNPAPSRLDIPFDPDDVSKLAPFYRTIAQEIKRRPMLPAGRLIPVKSVATDEYPFGVTTPWLGVPPPYDKPPGAQLLRSRNLMSIARLLAKPRGYAGMPQSPETLGHVTSVYDMWAMMLSPNSLHLTSVAPVVRRAKS